MSAQKCLLAAATLATGTTIDRWSRVGALAALVTLLVCTPPSASAVAALALSLSAALGQAVLAARTSLDERVFAQWGQHWQRDPSAADRDPAAFDCALHDQFGKQTEPRTLDARIQAALRLLQRQAFACAGQLFLLALSIALNVRGTQS